MTELNARDRFFEELTAAPTQAEAYALVRENAWQFTGLGPLDREHLYEAIASVIKEKPGGCGETR